MRKSLNAFLGALIVLSFVATAAMADNAGVATPAGAVNINTADAAQIALLPRIGLKAAQRVIDYRKEHGPFASTSDLMQVKGFGEKTLTRLSPYLTVEGKTTLTSKVQGSHKPRAQKSSKQPTTAAK
jgi:competence ComEA-like helix-hairpin-helix protein